MCDACDGEGVPELKRRSGEHTEEHTKEHIEEHTEDHHLIRCLAPEKDDDILSSTEQRLISLEDRMQSQFNNMQSQLDNMQSRFDDLNQDLTSRIGNIEQLLHKLAAASTSRSST